MGDMTEMAGGSIGTRLREERLRLGMSQSQMASLAQTAGVPGATRQSQANYETGRQDCSAAYLAVIAAAGADILYIVTGNRLPTSGETAFRTRLERLKLSTGLCTDGDIANLLCIKPSMFSMRIKSGSFPVDRLKAVAYDHPELDIDVQWVLTGVPRHA